MTPQMMNVKCIFYSINMRTNVELRFESKAKNNIMKYMINDKCVLRLSNINRMAYAAKAARLE